MDDQCTKMYLLDTEVKFEIEYDDEVQTAINGLYAENMIKEEEIIESDETRQAVFNLNFCEDQLLLETPKIENTDESNPQEYLEEEEYEISQSDSNHGKQFDAYVCGFCDYRTEFKRNLNKHVKTHSDPQALKKPILETQNEKTDQSEPEVCLIEEDSGSEEEITQSQLNNSISSKEYVCAFCPYKTHRRRNINQHSKTHSNGNEKQCSCSECGFKFSNERYLMVHKMRMHSDAKKESCSFCNYKSSNKNQLRKHVMTHTGEKPFPCTVCEYRCRDKSGLTRHMKVHSALTGKNRDELNCVDGEYSCSICGFKCSSAINLIRHKARRHTDEKPHCCSVCTYRSWSKYDLKKHVMTHTGEKPFSCPMCQFRCRDRSSLSKHFRTHS